MERPPDTEIIAPGRNNLIHYEPAHMYYRGQLHSAPEGTDEHRIYQKIATADFFMEQAPGINPEDNTIKDYVSQTIMTEEAIKGFAEMKV